MGRILGFAPESWIYGKEEFCRLLWEIFPDFDGDAWKVLSKVWGSLLESQIQHFDGLEDDLPEPKTFPLC